MLNRPRLGLFNHLLNKDLEMIWKSLYSGKHIFKLDKCFAFQLQGQQRRFHTLGNSHFIGAWLGAHSVSTARFNCYETGRALIVFSGITIISIHYTAYSVKIGAYETFILNGISSKILSMPLTRIFRLVLPGARLKSGGVVQ